MSIQSEAAWFFVGSFRHLTRGRRPTYQSDPKLWALKWLLNVWTPRTTSKTQIRYLDATYESPFYGDLDTKIVDRERACVEISHLMDWIYLMRTL